ncbi:putative chitinase [Microcystis phage Mel-JY01]
MDINKLRGHIPEGVFNELPMIIEKFQINTPLRMAHFLAQTAHESGNFRHVVENLNYSAERLKVIFPKYFNQPGLAEAYARKPELIGSRVYGNRMGNGPERSRDGFTFRGRGYLQLTGRHNYQLFDQMVEDDIVNYPNLVATKYPLTSAAWFFHRNNLNSISDRGATPEVVREVTRRVNGGTNGLEDRQRHFTKFHRILMA